MIKYNIYQGVVDGINSKDYLELVESYEDLKKAKRRFEKLKKGNKEFAKINGKQSILRTELIKFYEANGINVGTKKLDYYNQFM